jgi:hypothetical protein
MQTRDELLLTINAVIATERGNELREDQLLTESNLDSFSYAVFWLTIADKGINMEDEWIDSIDYENLTVAMIIDKILENNNGTN